MPKLSPADPIVKEVLQAFDNLTGPQPGFRPAHAKGVLLTGIFTPSAAAKALTRAPHIANASTPISVRFSDFAGVPVIPDSHPDASPHGLAIRFHLAEHVHTDIVAHSVDGFPARTVEEFVEFLHAVYATVAAGPAVSHPSPIEQFLGGHPAALAFVQAPKPMPVSFAQMNYFAVTAYKFINGEGTAQFGRYRIRPDGEATNLSPEAEKKAPADFLFDEIKQRLAKGPIKMKIAVQVAAAGDIVDDATAHWPEDRPEIDFGTIEISAIAPNNDGEQRHIIFDPIPRVDGIEPSDDPLLEPRAAVYLASGRRRRTAQPA